VFGHFTTILPTAHLTSKHKIQRQIDAGDKQIDKLIHQLYYVLYGLTEEEIKIVEGKATQ